ncbi:hypothetical protein EV401DRAFT_344959 [Pisolithus croceorrhizus]|nr:hypothetical protein EV401DRAFT_344959 [Pisolithus croceorrhizus]
MLRLGTCNFSLSFSIQQVLLLATECSRVEAVWRLSNVGHLKIQTRFPFLSFTTLILVQCDLDYTLASSSA